MKYDSIMVDLESMGTSPDSIIVGLGAVAFDMASGVVSDETFFRAINMGEAERLGRRMQASTVAWWLSQNKAAQNAIIWSTYPVRDALDEFDAFVERVSEPGEVMMWGNSPAFDNAMLSHLYHTLDREQPWKFWNDRDLRTLRWLYRHVEQDEFEGEKHNAADDALAQARHAVKIRNSVRKKP